MDPIQKDFGKKKNLPQKEADHFEHIAPETSSAVNVAKSEVGATAFPFRVPAPKLKKTSRRMGVIIRAPHSDLINFQVFLSRRIFMLVYISNAYTSGNIISRMYISYRMKLETEHA